MPTRFSALFFTVPLLSLTACNRAPEARRYTEVVTPSAESRLIAEAPIRVSWKLPDGWVAQDEGDPLRLAGFWAPDPALAHTGELDPQAVDVSIVQLAGDAGGLAANVTRWLGQIKIPAAQAPDALSKGEPIHTATGQLGMLLDFTDLLSGDMTQSKSIIGAIVQGKGYTVFVKAMGDRKRLVKIKPQIRAFCENLSIAEHAQ